jgi:hypothetical protein
MTHRHELCLEATNILSREVAFILFAIGKHPHKADVDTGTRNT